MTSATRRPGTWASTEANVRINTVKERLRHLGWQLVSGSYHSLPPFEEIQKWHRCEQVLYLVFSYKGDWDILKQLEPHNDIEAVFAAVQKISSPWQAMMVPGGEAKNDTWFVRNRFTNESRMAGDRMDAVKLAEVLNTP